MHIPMLQRFKKPREMLRRTLLLPSAPICRETFVIASKQGVIAKWLLNVIDATIDILISVTQIPVGVRQCRDEMQVIAMYRQHLYKFTN
jgi:hypothetical protein